MFCIYIPYTIYTILLRRINLIYLSFFYIKNVYMNWLCFSILLFIVIYLLIYKTNIRETFISNNKYEFLNREDGFKILGNPDYFNHFNSNDYKLRGCTSINVMEFYRKNIKDFNIKEKDALRWLLNDLIPKLRKCIKNFPYKRWRFIKVINLESNLPHTRDDCVVLPDWFMKKLVSYKKNKDINNALDDCGLTLIHEQTHIYQRLNKSIFNNLYKKYWNFENPNHINNLHLLDINRTNPDGLDIKWLYKKFNNRYVMPIAIYSEYAKDLTDTYNVLIEIIKMNNVFQFTDRHFKMKNNDEYNIFFGNRNNYHPNEISALYFSEYFKECNNLGNVKQPEGYTKFKIWLNKL